MATVEELIKDVRENFRREEAAAALVDVGTAAVKPLIGAFRAEQGGLVQHFGMNETIIGVLADIAAKDPSVADEVTAFLEEVAALGAERERQAARKALGREKREPTVREALLSSDYNLREKTYTRLKADPALRQEPEVQRAFEAADAVHEFIAHQRDPGDGPRALLAKAIELEPTFGAAYWYMSYFHRWHRGDNATALEWAIKGARLAPEDEHIWNELGLVYAARGEIYHAVTSFQRVLDLNPHVADVEPYLRLVLVYDVLNQRAAFEKAGERIERAGVHLATDVQMRWRQMVRGADRERLAAALKADPLALLDEAAPDTSAADLMADLSEAEQIALKMALTAFAEGKVVEQLIAYLREDPTGDVVEALVEFGGESVGPLKAAYLELGTDPTVKEAILGILRRIAETEPDEKAAINEFLRRVTATPQPAAERPAVAAPSTPQPPSNARNIRQWIIGGVLAIAALGVLFVLFSPSPDELEATQTAQIQRFTTDPRATQPARPDVPTASIDMPSDITLAQAEADYAFGVDMQLSFFFRVSPDVDVFSSGGLQWFLRSTPGRQSRYATIIALGGTPPEGCEADMEALESEVEAFIAADIDWGALQAQAETTLQTCEEELAARGLPITVNRSTAEPATPTIPAYETIEAAYVSRLQSSIAVLNRLTPETLFDAALYEDYRTLAFERRRYDRALRDRGAPVFEECESYFLLIDDEVEYLAAEAQPDSDPEVLARVRPLRCVQEVEERGYALSLTEGRPTVEPTVDPVRITDAALTAEASYTETPTPWPDTETPTPWPDTDGDGVPDNRDLCPNESDGGYWGGEDGCPPPPPEADGTSDFWSSSLNLAGGQ